MAQLQLDISLSVVNKVRGVAGQQLRAFENASGCSLGLVRSGGGAIVEIAGATAAQCKAAATMISNFVATLPNGDLPSPKPQDVFRPPLVYPTFSAGVKTPVAGPVVPVPQAQHPAHVRLPGPQHVPSQTAPRASQQIAGAATSQKTVISTGAATPQRIANIAPPLASSQKAVAASLVEIPLNIADKVREKAGELSTKSQCNFQVILERNRGLVKIEHPEIASRVNARKMLNELIAVLAPPQESSFVEKEKCTQSRPKRNFDSNNNSRTEVLGGWNEPVTAETDRVLKESRVVVKNFYTEHPEITALPNHEVAAFRKQNMDTNVKYLGAQALPYGIPKPVMSFEHAFGNYPEILEQLERKFEKPSPIQCQSWPILLSGLDMVGIAQTGTGKTLAFLLPAFIHIRGQPIVSKRYEGPTCLVLSPTRELAIQIYDETVKYAYQNIKCACCYGGAVRSTQMDQLRRNPEIIIATPGRLNDLVESMVVSLRRVSYLVLDEADRMLDMGFEPQIRQILQYISANRQTVMTSATWPPNVRKLSESFLRNPVQVTIGSLDLSAALTVTQRVRLVRADEKFPIVLNLMKSLKPNDRAIIFCGRKVTTDAVARQLNQNGIRAESIHGDRDQREREAALRHLRTGKSKILVATDVASRGLDVPEITVVVNFDFPQNIEEYVHRVGRTGRAGNTGSSYTMLTSGDSRFARELVKILEKAKQQVPEWLRKMRGS